MSNYEKSGSRRTRLRHSKKKGLSLKAKIIIIIASVVGAALIAGIIWGAVKLIPLLSYEPDTEWTESTKPEDLDIDTSIDFPEGIKNIALFGLDSRNTNFEGRSDSIMILSVNCDTGSLKLVSVVRDSLVKVEGHGYQKINAAYAFGGPLLAVKTLNKTFNLNITDYATVDFVGMAEIIDAVGGIEVELTKAEVPKVNESVHESADVFGTERTLVSEPGVQVLNGVQAVAFARIRKVPTVNGTRDDYGRTERQRLVMSKLLEKALDQPWTKYPDMIKTMLPYIRSSMGYDEIFELAKVLTKDDVAMVQGRIPTDQAIISSGYSVPYLGSCVYYDLDYAAKLLSAFFFQDITFEQYMELNGVEKNRWYDGPTYKPTTDTSTDTPSDTTDNPTDTAPSFPITGTGTGNKPRPTGSGGNGTGNTTDTGTEPDSGKTDSGNKTDATDKTDGTDKTDSAGSNSTDTGGASDQSNKNE